MKELFEEVRKGTPHLFLGKSGLSEGFVENVKSLLKKKRIIKIKIQKGVFNKETLVDTIIELSKRTRSHCLDQRGRVFILSKKLIPDVHQPKRFTIEKKEDNI